MLVSCSHSPEIILMKHRQGNHRKKPDRMGSNKSSNRCNLPFSEGDCQNQLSSVPEHCSLFLQMSCKPLCRVLNTIEAGEMFIWRVLVTILFPGKQGCEALNRQAPRTAQCLMWSDSRTFSRDVASERILFALLPSETRVLSILLRPKSMNAFTAGSQPYLLSQEAAAVVVVIIIAGFMIVVFCSCVQ